MVDESQYLSRQKKYKHFDYILSTNTNFTDYANPRFVENYRFYPFIEFNISFRKYNGKKVKLKNRKIELSSHGASLIYKMYAEKLTPFYETFVMSNGIEKVATAYRTSRGSNIESAKEVFDFIDQTKECYIIKGDFMAFFDNLKSNYLKTQLNTVLGVNSLPSDWYKVFSSLTRYQKIDRNTLEKLISRDKLAEKQMPYFENRKEFSDFYNNHKNMFVHNTNGIPQGTALSALLANVYMIEFDMYVNNLMNRKGGIYRRYSDDFILVLPANMVDEHEVDILKNQLRTVSLETLGLTIEKSKTHTYKYVAQNIRGLDNTGTSIDYLGFKFTGNRVSFREKSIYKFAYKSKRKAIKIAQEKIDMKIARKYDSFEQLIFSKPNSTYRKAISYSPAENVSKRHRISLVQTKIRKNENFTKNRKRIASLLVTNQRVPSFYSYAYRAQEILSAGNPSYAVDVLKQARKRVNRNQKMMYNHHQWLKAYSYTEQYTYSSVKKLK